MAAGSETNTKRCTKCGETKLCAEFNRNSRHLDGLEIYCRGCIKLKNQQDRVKHGARRDAESRERRRLKSSADPDWARRKMPPAGMKHCPRCGVVKPVASFGVSSGRVQGLQCWCRDCKAADERRYRKANRAAVKARAADYYLRNMAKIRARNRAWQKANPHRVREMERRSHRRHADKVRLRRQAYERRRAEMRRDYARQRRRMFPDVFRAYCNARRARIAAAAGRYTATDVRRILAAQRGRCAYCRVLMRGKHTVDHITALSNGGGNCARNIQLLCVSCNSSKRALDPLVFAQRLGRLL